MTTQKNQSVAKLSKNERRLKRDAATKLANLLLQIGSKEAKKTDEVLEKFVKLIDELDACKEKIKGRPQISSIFELAIFRDKKYILEKMVKNYREKSQTKQMVEA